MTPEEEKKVQEQYDSLTPTEKGEVMWCYMTNKALKEIIIWKDPIVRNHVKDIVREVLNENGVSKEKIE